MVEPRVYGFAEELRRLRRFVLVGILNAAFGYAIYSVFILVSLPPWLALLIATCLGIAFNFLTFGRLVFKSIAGRLAPRFALTYSGMYAVNLFVLKSLILIGLHPLVAQALSLPIIVPCTYFALRLLVFRN
jgi:putative flippase GtrA